MYSTDIGSLDARVASDLDPAGRESLNHLSRRVYNVYLAGESMTGCLDELMDKANEMGLDECWDEVSDEDKAVLEPMFRLHLYFFSMWRTRSILVAR